MRTAVRVTEAARDSQDGRGGQHRAKVVIRRIDPWSVLKFSVLFYLCLMLIFVFSLVILYWILGVTGAIASVTDVIADFWGDPDFTIHGYWLISRIFVIGLAGVVFWSLVNLLVALLYNLIADVVGGIRLTLGERK